MNEKVITFIKQNKVHVIIWAFGLLFFAFLLYRQLTKPSILLHGFMINTVTTAEDTVAEDLAADFAKSYNVDTDRGDVVFDDHYICVPDDDSKAEETSETANEILISYGEQSVDFVTAPTSVLLRLTYDIATAKTFVFSDLNTLLTDEQKKLYEPYLLYIDLAVVEELQAEYEETKDTSAIKYPDPSKPDKMKSPMAVAIDLSSSPKLAKLYGEKSEPIAFAILDGTPSQVLTLNFLEYMMFNED